MIISLTGFMGCGKSSIGRKLSELLCCPLIDLDSHIEAETGRSIPEIFESDGEDAFRRMEKAALEKVLSTSHDMMILSLGGGTVMTKECAEMVRERSICIYLRAGIDTLADHLEGETSNRPMLSSAESHDPLHEQKAEGSILRERISALMAKRSSTYEGTAHHIIDIDGKQTDEIADDVRRAIRL
ncbi:MAG: shikimate kinase [Bacteroidales bacterium]|nr:shikimate kinase [Bacteroidales bacterium]